MIGNERECPRENHLVDEPAIQFFSELLGQLWVVREMLRNLVYHGLMKATIEVPEETFATLLRLTRAKTKREAILAAIEDYNRSHQVKALVATFGTWKMDSKEELESADPKDTRGDRSARES